MSVQLNVQSNTDDCERLKARYDNEEDFIALAYEGYIHYTE